MWGFLWVKIHSEKILNLFMLSLHYSLIPVRMVTVPQSNCYLFYVPSKNERNFLFQLEGEDWDLLLNWLKNCLPCVQSWKQEGIGEFSFSVIFISRHKKQRKSLWRTSHALYLLNLWQIHFDSSHLINKTVSSNSIPSGAQCSASCFQSALKSLWIW